MLELIAPYAALFLILGYIIIFICGLISYLKKRRAVRQMVETISLARENISLVRENISEEENEGKNEEKEEIVETSRFDLMEI